MDIKTINAYSAREFRAWLRKNHKKETKVAVILHKKHTGKTAPTHRQMIEEAICYGWIDTTIKRLDEDTFLRHFSRRNSKSKWSDNTLSYAKRLLKEGKMSTEGKRFYTLGLSRPTHDYGIPKDPPMPLELKKALSKNKTAKKNFELYPPSMKKMLYRWILHGKLAETRAKRIARVIQGANKGERNIV
ncbi:YdeI/OmpD-associated family protein [Acetobacteraceae bacterium]|nr:YdeI/OmpD-associated family protein [Candidatus Parcubacteria bacterium]